MLRNPNFYNCHFDFKFILCYFETQSTFNMEKDSSLQQLNEIRTMMERSSRFISLSGLSGISAGIIALIGSAFIFFYLNFDTRYFNIDKYFREGMYHFGINDAMIILITAIVILASALGFAIYFTTRKARKKGLSVWTRTTKLLLYNVAIPLITGGVFCFILVYYRLIFLIAPTTLVFYGLALLNGSKYTLPEIQWLGISEILLGLVACILPGYGLFFWAIGFGVLHIVYGAVMYKKYEISPHEQ